MKGRGPMVSSSTGAMNSLLDKLSELESMRLVRRDLESLRNDVLEKFAGRGVIRGAKIKEWMEQVREVVYDMEDWIDLCIRPSKPDKPELATNFGWSDDIAEQIEEFKAQIQEAQDRCKRYGLLDEVPTSDADLADLGVPRKVTIDPKLLHGEEPGLVALDDPTNHLVNHLIDEEQKLKVVSVLGMGGLGKTTLAKEVYRRQQQSGFKCLAFVYVGRNPSIKTTLINTLHQVMPPPQGNMESWDEQQMVAELWKFLGNERYFIVLDDIWTIRDWKVISCAFPDNDLGSRILTTTCIMDVAKSCSIRPSDVIYRVKALSENDSRSLFRSRISVQEKERPGDFNKVADDMLRECGGMPLAIIVATGLLDRKSAELGPSKKLEGSSSLALDQYSTSQGIRKILDMSYADLSLPLKSCFLYLSAFPENYTIKKDRSIWIWIAEGFIPKRDEESLWETGESYFNELISRRLIQPVFDYANVQAVGCTVHGVILDFIASLSSEDNFVITGAELRSGPFPRDTIRRFSFDCSNKDEDDDTLASSTVDLSRVRSLTFFGDVKGMPGEILHLSFLRVLDLEDAGNLRSHHLKGIEGLVLLRYLGLRGTGIDELPEKIGQLEHLETLDLRQTTRLTALPASIVGLRKLVCLLLNERVEGPKEIWKMQELEEASTIGVDVISLNSVSELLIKSKRLRMLGLRWGGYSYDRRSFKSFLYEVRKSSLQSLLLEGYPDDLLDFLLDSWVSPHHLRRFELTISGTLFRGVPPMMALLVNLTHLRIKIGRVETEGLRVLGDLPNLILLNLHSEYSGFGRLIISRHGFRCLVVFSYTCPWMGLQFTPGAVPQLRRLRFEFNAQETGFRYGDFDFGIQHLSCLTRVHATIHYWVATYLKWADAAIREQVSKNPNTPVLELKREELKNRGGEVIQILNLVGSALGKICGMISGALKNGLDSIKLELEMIQVHIGKNEDEGLQLQELVYDVEDFIDGLWEPGASGPVLTPIGRDPRPQHIDCIAHFKERIKRLQEWQPSDSRQSGGCTARSGPSGSGCPYTPEDELVGIAEANDELLELLLEADGGQPRQVRVISIVGCRGLGKTALARALYDNFAASNAFDCIAWVVASGCNGAEGLVNKILQQVRPAAAGETTSHVKQPITELHDILKDNRYLVVVDDVQRAEVWKEIERAFPKNSNSSRIIVTTSLHSVANACSSGSFVYTMQYLDQDKSKRLLWRKFCSPEELTPSLVDSSKSILDKCGGLPLALISAANYVRQNLRRSDCEVLGQALGDYLAGNEPAFGAMRRALVQCYDSLPDYGHKTCLLSLSIFPRGPRMNRKSLVRRWIAEGLVDVGGVQLNEEEIACQRLEELIDRSIIEPVLVSNGPNKVVERCQVHSVMLEFIIHKSVSNNFVTLIREDKLLRNNNCRVRRLSVQNSRNEGGGWVTKDLSSIRSLTICSGYIFDFKDCKLLRVLDLEGCKGITESVLDVICKLRFLKYLSVRGSDVSRIPKRMGKLYDLETLDIRETRVEILPVEVIMLPRLAHLFGRFELSRVSQEMSDELKKGSLQTLAGVVIDKEYRGFEQIMLHARKLSKVKIWHNTTPRGNNSTVSSLLWSLQKRFIGSKALDTLSIDSSDLSKEFLRSLEATCGIRTIKLRGKLESLPQSTTLSGLRNLNKLHLLSTGLSSEALSVLQRLPCLKYLKLAEDRHEFGEGSFVVDRDGFRRLQHLCFEAPKLPLLQIEQGAMTKLTSLQMLCQEFADGLGVTGIEHLQRLNEVILHSSASDAVMEAWKRAAIQHPNRPSVKKQPINDAA